jgi:hypothetical protein
VNTSSRPVERFRVFLAMDQFVEERNEQLSRPFSMQTSPSSC